MRRQDREVTDLAELGAILQACKTCHLAMIDAGRPYVVPLSYGYTLVEGQLTLYFHSAKEGRKIEVLRENADVCFEMSTEGVAAFAQESPCNSGYFFSSIIGFGRALFVHEVEEKCEALTLLMRHQAGIETRFTAAQADPVCVFKVVAHSFTGKTKPMPGGRGGA